MKKLVSKWQEIRKNLKTNKGFTLVELIVVIVILAILIGVSVSGYSKYIGQSKINTDKNNAETIRAAIVNAQAEEGVYEYLIGVKDFTNPVLTVTMNTEISDNDNAITGPKVDGKDNPLVAAVKKAVDVSSLKTQAKDGTITIKAKVEDSDGKSEGTISVEITSDSPVYGDAFGGAGGAGGAGGGEGKKPETPPETE